MPVKSILSMAMNATETIDNNAGSLNTNKSSVTHSAYDLTTILDGDSAVPVTEIAGFEVTLSAGAATVDLTALTGTNAAVVDGTGLKVQAIHIAAHSENTAVVSVGDGASNGYELAGDGWGADLTAGQRLMFYGNEAAPDISGTAKTIDLASTDPDAKVQCVVLMG